MKSINYFSLLKNLKYRRLLCSNLINRLGDAIDTLAFSWIVYAFTGEGLWAAIIFAINKIPTFLVLPFAGAYVEKFNKKNVIIICDIIRCVFVLMLLITFCTKQLSIAIFAIIAFCISMAEAFRMPASTAFLTQILNKDEFDKGITLNVAMSTIVEMIGTALGGIFITYLEAQIAIITDAISFIISILFIIKIPYSENIEDQIKISNNWTLLKSGLTYIWSYKILVSTFVIAVLANAAMSPIDSLQTVVVVNIFHSNASYLSIINICLSIGMILGGMLYPTIRIHINDWIIFRCSFFFIAFLYLIIALVGFTENINDIFKKSFCGLYIFYGIFASFLAIGLGLIILENTQQNYMARVNTWFSAIGSAATPIVATLTGYLTKYFSISVVYITISCIIICLLIISISKKRNTLKLK